MNPRVLVPALFVIGTFATTAFALPRIGYVYPAGGQAGSSFEVIMGGQSLDQPLGVVISGEGVSVEVVEHDKIPSAQVIDDYRDKFRELKPELEPLKGSSPGDAKALREAVSALLAGVELDEKKLRLMWEYDRRRNDPKQQLNTQIGEVVRVRVTIDSGTEPGMRHWRLQTASGLSNPMRFVVGAHPERNEPEAHRFDLLEYAGLAPAGSRTAERGAEPITLPVTLNGRILPGEVDEFTFYAREGEKLVVSLQARNLIPYLADAVPGWFQTVVSLHDARGKELAFADDYRFDPDPVIFYKIPREGDYRLRIRDSIYRGREDFVYRVTLGELPFITGISPLGARAGSEVDLTFHGANLSEQHFPRHPVPGETGIVELTASGPGGRSNPIAFHVEAMTEEAEREDNNRLGAANPVPSPGLVNGTISVPGDVDFFKVEGRGGRPMSFEIFARRLGSPLDANLTVYDDDGEMIAYNDDYENPAAGLTTHHADARVTVTLPGNGRCFVRVADTQNRYGYAHAYRLRVAEGVPNFALRATPASLNAKPGASARLTVHVLRIDGFDGPVSLRLKDAPEGFELKGGPVPSGEDKADVSIAVPYNHSGEPVALQVEGTAEIEGKTVVVEAVPAEDMMQAFAYRHLVPADRLLVEIRTPPEPPKP
ncbi:MAG: PPC domain-containing protein [Verrucomicrobiae bacterium]|nr:PPC domain-containing protein [Verrucomicrobiae bacterium]